MAASATPLAAAPAGAASITPSAAAPSPFAAFFDNPDLADAEVVVVAAAAAAPGGGGGAAGDSGASSAQRVLARLPAHRIVLKAASERWAAELERWPTPHHHHGAAGSSTTAPVPAVTIGVAGPHEAPLARALLQAAYSGRLGASEELAALALAAAEEVSDSEGGGREEERMDGSGSEEEGHSAGSGSSSSDNSSSSSSDDSSSSSGDSNSSSDNDDDDSSSSSDSSDSEEDDSSSGSSSSSGDDDDLSWGLDQRRQRRRQRKRERRQRQRLQQREQQREHQRQREQQERQQAQQRQQRAQQLRRRAREEAALLRLLELAHCAMAGGVARLVCARLVELSAAAAGSGGGVGAGGGQGEAAAGGDGGGGGLSWPSVLRLLNAPEDLRAAPAFAPLRAALAAAVRSRLGDLEAALGEEMRARDLAALPLRALARLLASSRTRAAGEASAVAAVNLWLAARGGAEAVGKEVCARALCPCVFSLPLSGAQAVALCGG